MKWLHGNLGKIQIELVSASWQMFVDLSDAFAHIPSDTYQVLAFGSQL